MLNVQNKNSSYFVEWIPNNVKSSVRRCTCVSCRKPSKVCTYHLHVHWTDDEAALQLVLQYRTSGDAEMCGAVRYLLLPCVNSAVHCPAAKQLQCPTLLTWQEWCADLRHTAEGTQDERNLPRQHDSHSRDVQARQRAVHRHVQA